MVAIPVSREAVEASNGQARRLRELLHAPEILVMPGAYDPLSALLCESLGFKAIQGSSGAIAAVFGVRDGEIIPREDAVEVYRRMVQAVRVPVNADGEKGYGGPGEVAETVRRLIGTGVAGMNLEDSDYRRPNEGVRLLSVDAQLEKIHAVMVVKQTLGSEFFLNARVDAFNVDETPQRKLEEAINRGNIYAENGADCIFYLGVSDAATIGTLVKEVRAPVSILANAACPSVKVLEDLGVARVSYGGAFLRVALTAIKQLAEILLTKGDPSGLLQQGLPNAEMLPLLRDRLAEG